MIFSAFAIFCICWVETQPTSLCNQFSKKIGNKFDFIQEILHDLGYKKSSFEKIANYNKNVAIERYKYNDKSIQFKIPTKRTRTDSKKTTKGNNGTRSKGTNYSFDEKGKTTTKSTAGEVGKTNARYTSRVFVRGIDNSFYSLEENIPDDIDEILPKVKKPENHSIAKILTPISTRLENINPRIKHAVRKFDFESALKENEYSEAVKPFIDNLSKMSEADYAKYDLALKNGNSELVEELNKKYNLVDDFNKVKDLLKEIREKALEVGFNIGYVDDYFPRKVINSAKYKEYLSENSSFIKEKLEELDTKGMLIVELSILFVGFMQCNETSDKIFA